MSRGRGEQGTGEEGRAGMEKTTNTRGRRSVERKHRDEVTVGGSLMAECDRNRA